MLECYGLKPCWEGDSEICGVIRFSISRFMTLKAVFSSVMGLSEVTSVGSLLGLRIATMMLFYNLSGCNLLYQ